MGLLNNGTQINTIIMGFGWELFSWCRTPVRPSGWMGCLWRPGECISPTYGLCFIWVQVDWVQGYDEDQIDLVIPDLSNFTAWVPVILGTPMISCIVNMIKEKEMDALAIPWVNAWVAHLLAVQWATATVEDFKVVVGSQTLVNMMKWSPPRILRPLMHSHPTLYMWGQEQLVLVQG